MSGKWVKTASQPQVVREGFTREVTSELKPGTVRFGDVEVFGHRQSLLSFPQDRKRCSSLLVLGPTAGTGTPWDHCEQTFPKPRNLMTAPDSASQCTPGLWRIGYRGKRAAHVYLL